MIIGLAAERRQRIKPPGILPQLILAARRRDAACAGQDTADDQHVRRGVLGGRKGKILLGLGFEAIKADAVGDIPVL
jgi:hypothetical protein